MSIVIIGLVVCVAIAVLIVLLVALPGLRSEGRIPDNEAQNFRLPHSWTGFDDEDSVDGLFGRGDDDYDEREYEPAGAFPGADEEHDKRTAKKRAKAERAARKSSAADERASAEPAPADSRRTEPEAGTLAVPVAAPTAGTEQATDTEQVTGTEQASDPEQPATPVEAASPEYEPQLQSMRHALPPVWSGRPRTRHWRVPESGEGVKTAAKLLIG